MLNERETPKKATDALSAENERLSYLAYGPRHDSDCPALWGAGDCRCDLRERIDDWREERHMIDPLEGK